MDTWNALTVQTASGAITSHDMNASFRRRNLMVRQSRVHPAQLLLLIRLYIVLCTYVYCIHPELPLHCHHRHYCHKNHNITKQPLTPSAATYDKLPSKRIPTPPTHLLTIY